MLDEVGTSQSQVRTAAILFRRISILGTQPKSESASRLLKKSLVGFEDSLVAVMAIEFDLQGAVFEEFGGPRSL